jgi:hypothetical protein
LLPSSDQPSPIGTFRHDSRRGEGAGAALITEEALTPAAMTRLREALEEQPAWADLPLLIFTSQPSAELIVHASPPGRSCCTAPASISPTWPSTASR